MFWCVSDLLKKQIFVFRVFSCCLLLFSCFWVVFRLFVVVLVFFAEHGFYHSQVALIANPKSMTHNQGPKQGTRVQLPAGRNPKGQKKNWGN